MAAPFISRRVSAYAKKTGRSEAATQEGSPLRSGVARVLVVEDNPFNLHVFEEFLSDMGHAVTTATNGRQALDILRNKAFDLVLMDVQMPEMDGVEMVRRLRLGECGEQAASLPVIALTAYAMAGDRERFLQAGMTDYLSKPVTQDRLCEAVAYLRARLGEALSMLNAEDFPGAAKAGHDIKGMAMGLSLAPLLPSAAAFEGSCRAGDAVLAAKHAGEIETALTAVQEGLAASGPVQEFSG